MTSVDSTTKTCSKCKQTYPATLEFFRALKRNQSGLHSWCRACCRKANHEYGESHSDTIREKNRKYRAVNRDKYRAYHKKWRMSHLDQKHAATRKWAIANPDKCRAKTHRRKALQRNAYGSNLPFNENVQFERQHGKCYYCQCKLSEYHVEHIVPLSRGGSDHPDNKVLACPSCNLSKSNKLPHEWFKGGKLL